jgi:hypothetical protein
MSQKPPSDQGKPRWTGIAIALFVMGLLVLVPSGLCTGLGMIFALSPYGRQDPSMVLMVLTFGGVPMAFGAFLVYAGLKSRRRD